MARRRKPENETGEQANERRIFETISNASDRSEKTSWNRKLDNMIKLMARLSPIEDQIIELMNEKIPIFDDIQKLRLTMINECIHPYDNLVLKDDHVYCKFCDRKISLPKEPLE